MDELLFHVIQNNILIRRLLLLYCTAHRREKKLRSLGQLLVLFGARSPQSNKWRADRRRGEGSIGGRNSREMVSIAHQLKCLSANEKGEADLADNCRGEEAGTHTANAHRQHSRVNGNDHLINLFDCVCVCVSVC